jgi:hypothetical protein
MYLAEIHGKLSRENENKEDILTSNVFSFFKYADRNTFFHPLLHQLGLNVDQEDVKNAIFTFWPTFEDGTEPDLVIKAGKYYILVEAKYHSGFGQEVGDRKHQLIREVKGGANQAKTLGKTFIIVTVTSDHYQRPEDFKEYPVEFQDNLRWINWQKIAFLIYQIIQNHPEIPNETLLFAQDLYDLFLKKDLRNFEGVKVFKAIPPISSAGEILFFQSKTTHFIGRFDGFDSLLLNFPNLKPFDKNESLFFENPLTK